MDVQRKTQELAEALANSESFQALQKARKTVEEHEAARIMLRDFKKKQEKLVKQQQEGQEITPDQMEEVRKLYEIMNINPYLQELLEAEFAFGSLMMEVQNTLAQTLGLGEPESEEETPVVETPTKKLWTPGN